MPAREWRARPAPPALVDGWLPAVGLAAVYGAPGVAKSMIALDLAAQATTGGTWCGQKIEPIPRALYVAAEAASSLAPRLDAWCTHYGAEPSIDVLPEPVHFGSNAAGELAAHLRDHPYPLVIVDTWTKCTAGLDENSGRDIAPAVERLLALNPNGLTVILHHPTKGDDKVMRGHSSLLAALDTSIHVGRRGDARLLTVTKQRDMEEGSTALLVVRPVGHSAVIVSPNPTEPLDTVVAALHPGDTRKQWAERLVAMHGFSLRTAQERITAAIKAGLVVNTGSRQRASYERRPT